MKRRSGLWLGFFSCLLASELVSACDDVWGRAIVIAPENGTGGVEGTGGNEATGGEPDGGDSPGTSGAGGIVGTPEGGSAGAGDAGSTSTGGIVGSGGSSGGSGGGGGTGTGGSMAGGNAGSGGSAGKTGCSVVQLGYSTVPNMTTGGLGGAVVKVSTAEQLKTQVARTEPVTIQIDSQITLTEQIRPKPNKTIIGVGKNAELTGGGLYIVNTSNIIVQNLKITKALKADAIGIDNSHHVWIDHCELSSDLSEPNGTYDDLVAITHGSDYVTVSWTYFHDHYSTSLVGNSEDTGSEDMGHLTVTYHHNVFSNVQSNVPRVRFGNVHFFNNLLQNVAANAVISQMGAQVYVEGNVFQTVGVPITTQYQDPSEGGVTERDNSFSADSGDRTITTAATWVPSTVYDYKADSTDNLPVLVNACAGVGKL